MAREKVNYFEIWFQDKESILETMVRNLQADLNTGYNPMGECVYKQRLEIVRYRNAFHYELDCFKTMDDTKVNRWCYYDLKKEGGYCMRAKARERSAAIRTAKECGYGNETIDRIFLAETSAEIERALVSARKAKADDTDARVLNLYHLKRLKRLAMAGLAIVSLSLMPIKAKANEYPNCGVVTEVTKTETDYEITVTFWNGNMFSFVSEDGDWMENDICALIMDDQGTETIYDDVVISAKYCGYYEGR